MVLSDETESFLGWVSMDAGQFADHMQGHSEKLNRSFSREQLILVWDMAMEYVESDPDTNGSKLSDQGRVLEHKNFFAFLMSTGILMGALSCEEGKLMPLQD